MHRKQKHTCEGNPVLPVSCFFLTSEIDRLLLSKLSDKYAHKVGISFNFSTQIFYQSWLF